MVNKSSGQLFYLASCAKSQTSVAVTSTSTQFKACYQAFNGVTRKVPESTKCSNKTTNKENTIPKVPADSDSLYFCVGTDGTIGVEGMAATSSPGIESYVSGLNPAGNGTLLISATSGFSNCSSAP